MQKPFRVRFAPSPTGALHIGGVRTALYNYLLAKKHGGTFILRIEDTDQTRYIPGAEEYIRESLEWCGLLPDEGPGYGGNFGPYRQSERREIYLTYAQKLVEERHAYFAFDTVEDLEEMRTRLSAAGVHSPTYNAAVRMDMKNSLTLDPATTEKLIREGTPYTIRLKVEPGQEVVFHDAIRGEVRFATDELDDKVLLKADGMPTYHMANVVDDYLMQISHVIRGEEWLSSTAHHVLLYRALGIDEPPVFAHLPLILKPTGKGKLSKRDGQQLGFPVFPLKWESVGEAISGFREFGFLPEAVINFLAFLGWNPGTEQEIFSLNELANAFSLEKVSKSGARFDYEKALWYNQQYLKTLSGEELARLITPLVSSLDVNITSGYLIRVCDLMKERVHLLPEIILQGKYFFSSDFTYDEETLAKRYKPESLPVLEKIKLKLNDTNYTSHEILESDIKQIISDAGIGMGAILPMLRLAVAGTLQGPDLFQMMTLIGSDKCAMRIDKLTDHLKNAY